MKPRMTLGNAAMISTTGLTTPFSVGCMNCEAYSALKRAMGTANSMA
jgi:hypothetical protein